MRKKGLIFLGVLLVVLGAVLLLSSFSGMTGFAVFEGVSSKVGGVVGVVFVLGGLGVLMARAHHTRAYG
ncbi:MAG: hypothetical protein ABH864_01185 [archaeon]